MDPQHGHLRHRKLAKASLTTLVLLPSLFISAGIAHAELAEDLLLSGIEAGSTSLFPLNPAVHELSGTRGGILVMRNTKNTKLDQTKTGGDVIKSETSEDYVNFGTVFDLGAGAGLALSHQTLFRVTETSFATRERDDPKAEYLKQQHSAVKLIVELIDGLRAGMTIRYLYKDISLFGDATLKESEKTSFRSTLVGYGSGFVYSIKNFGVAYTYYPPLRGKADIEGEERIIVEPGEILIDGYYRPNDQWTVGVVGKRWLNELDDRATGTTASDNETNISLYGLDPDQYVFQKKLVMLGVEYQLTKAAAMKLSAGQEQAEFNFMDLRRYNRIDVQQGKKDADESVKYNRYRAMVKFTNQGIELDAGAGLFSRRHDFPQSMNAGSYEANGKELFATISMKL